MPSGPLLRSESLNRFRALGTQGSPVFASAAQLRSAIIRQMGADVADILAIPQINEAGDRVDWYAPYPGPVIPWSAAAPDEQAQARTAIEMLRQRLKDHSTTLLAQLAETKGSHTSAAETFAHLLPLAGIAPDDSHVYLVSGKPVVTFWGFEPLHAPTNWDALGHLSVTSSRATSPAAATAVPVATVTPWWRWLLWLLLLLLLLALLLFGLRFCGLVSVPLPEALVPYVPQETPALPTVDIPSATQPLDPQVRHGAVVVPGTTIPGVLRPDGTIVPEGTVLPDGSIVPEGTVLPDGSIVPEGTQPPDIPTDAKADLGHPDNLADQSPPVPETENKDNAEQKDQNKVPDRDNKTGADTDKNRNGPDGKTGLNEDKNASTNAGKDAEKNNQGQAPLVIPPNNGANGNTDFLNGQWQSRAGLVDAATGKPLEMQYSFKDGKGEVQLRRQDGIVCSAPVTPSMSNGTLVIDQSQAIRCPDGKTYQPSQVQCRNAAGGKAACKGSYADGTGYSVTITQ